MSDKQTQKELKQPDAFQQAGVEAQAWFAERQTLVLALLGLIVAGGFVAALVHYFSLKSEAKAAQQLGQALEVVSRPVGAEAQPGSTLPGEPPPFPDQKAKDEATVKELREFLSTHSKASTAYAASLPLGQAAYRLGQYDDALKAFDDVIQQAPKDEPLRAAALEGRGYAFEAKGDLDQAYKAFETLASENATEFLQGMGRYHQGRILMKQGKKEEAAKLFSELPKEAPNTVAARLAGERMTSLIAQGVTPPAPAAPAAAAAPTDAGVATP